MKQKQIKTVTTITIAERILTIKNLELNRAEMLNDHSFASSSIYRAIIIDRWRSLAREQFILRSD